ncbi:MAG TPA: PCRF domain-containing protein, partial [Ignavibacteriaceae bacterium]|nr:PCRF domain-containing protein [Ignavibacteriaceae bacterium]
MAAQKTLQEIKSLKIWIDLWQDLNNKAISVDETIQLAEMEKDESLYDDIIAELDALEKSIEEAEFKNMLSGENDDKNCLLTIHSGAGGTESQDWADMLLRMYLRWGEQNNFT